MANLVEVSKLKNDESNLNQVLSPLDLPPSVFAEGLERRRQNRAALMRWVKAAMVEGVDFGCIQTKRGLSKPSLWKPGAEKICGMLGIIVRYPTLGEYESAVLSGVDVKRIILRCELVDGFGNVVASGVGARSLEQDFGDLNKAMKMAEKSAHIDATLRVAGLSEVFTQDIEDMPGMKDMKDMKDMKAPQRVEEKTMEQEGAAEIRAISLNQEFFLSEKILELGLDESRVLDWLRRATHGRVSKFCQIPLPSYAKVMAKLDNFATAAA